MGINPFIKSQKLSNVYVNACTYWSCIASRSPTEENQRKKIRSYSHFYLTQNGRIYQFDHASYNKIN